jgi:hypothetical protein
MKRFFASITSLSLLCLMASPALSQKGRIVPTLKKETKNVRQSEPTFISEFAGAAANSNDNGTVVSWKTARESRVFGFMVHRMAEGSLAPVDGTFVAGGAVQTSDSISFGRKYSFFDANGKSGDVYYVESIGMNGERTTFGPVESKYSENPAANDFSDSMRNMGEKNPDQAILQGEKPELPSDLKTEFETNSLAPDLNRQRWVAAQPGVKIGVKQEGMYRVSRTELQNAGFDVNAPSQNWQLYVDGNEQSIIVGPADAYIEFYGTGIDTVETASRIYFLVNGSVPGKRMDSKFIRGIGGSVPGKSYIQTFARKERIVYISSNILNGDVENFFSNLPIIGSSSPTPATVTLTFNLTGVDFSSGKARMGLSFQGITSTQHQLIAKINGEEVNPVSGSGIVMMSDEFSIPVGYLNEGLNTLQIQTFGGAGDINLTESFRVTYARKFLANQNRISFYTQHYKTTRLTGFTSPNVRVLDLTYPDSPAVVANAAVENVGGDFQVVLPAHRGRVMYAVDDSALMSASSITQNYPSTYSTTAHNGDMIIITHRDWLTESNQWANFRRGQGLTVEVVDIQDIYDEFNYGAASTLAVTNFLSYASGNWQTPPDYVLLIGDATYDFRNYENRAPQGFIPTKRVDTLYEETGSDEAMCDFNEDGLAELAVGRIPARSGAVVTQLLQKTQTFEAGLATAQSRGALFASDLPNGYDFEALSQRVASNLPASMPKFFISRGIADSKTVLINKLNEGPMIVNYSGHGSSGIWDGNWMTIPDANALQNGSNGSLYFMLTCLNGYFIRTDADSLAEALLKSPNGGGPMAWASSGKTTPDVQEVMAARFYSQYTLSSMNRVGDLVKDAKSILQGGRDVRLSWALLGDPALRLKP